MISLDHLKDFGCVILNEDHQFKESFSVTFISEQGIGCTVLNSMAFYTGEDAPRIQYCLTAKGQNDPFIHHIATGSEN